MFLIHTVPKLKLGCLNKFVNTYLATPVSFIGSAINIQEDTRVDTDIDQKI